MSATAVIYLRVSTEDQAESGLSLTAQETACRALADREGWTIAAVYRDEGVSGAKPLDKRPGLAGAIGALARGGVLVIAKRDRVFRTDPFDSAIIERAVASQGARIASAAGEGTHDDSPSSKLMASILDAFGRYERLVGITRTTDALRAKRAKGERCGQVAYGFRVAADGRTLEPEPADHAAADVCRRLAAEGVPLRRIAAELGAMGFRPKRGGETFGASTIRRLLQGKPPPCPET